MENLNQEENQEENIEVQNVEGGTGENPIQEDVVTKKPLNIKVIIPVALSVILLIAVFVFAFFFMGRQPANSETEVAGSERDVTLDVRDESNGPASSEDEESSITINGISAGAEGGYDVYEETDENYIPLPPQPSIPNEEAKEEYSTALMWKYRDLNRLELWEENTAEEIARKEEATAIYNKSIEAIHERFSYLSRPVEINITARNFDFNTDEIHINDNEITILSFESIEGSHNWTLGYDEMGMIIENIDDVPEGSKLIIVWFSEGAPDGEYEFFCSTPGHKEKGMTAKFMVENK